MTSDAIDFLRTRYSWLGTPTDSAAHSCGCIGPQNGQPLCPCAMRSVTIENGRYVRREDLGPVREASKAFTKEYSEFNRLMGDQGREG